MKGTLHVAWIEAPLYCCDSCFIMKAFQTGLWLPQFLWNPRLLHSAEAPANVAAELRQNNQQQQCSGAAQGISHQPTLPMGGWRCW